MRRLYGAEKRADARNVKKRRSHLSGLERKRRGEVFCGGAGRVISLPVRVRRHFVSWDIFRPLRREEEDDLCDMSRSKCVEGQGRIFCAGDGNKSGEGEWWITAIELVSPALVSSSLSRSGQYVCCTEKSLSHSKSLMSVAA